MNHSIRKISITGPECTGKSQLAETLAQRYNTVWVPEYSRFYLNSIDHPYTLKDIENITRGQMASESRLINAAEDFMFCDTDVLVNKVWCEYKYGECPEWIGHLFREHTYDLYLLMDVDLPWEEDSLRENPESREGLFAIYKSELDRLNLRYFVVSGHGDERFRNAEHILSNYFSF